jgi:Ni,Fe-hydrogenase I cytochrome b subunit
MRRMTATRGRPLLHMIHLVTAVILFATGLLLLLPALRAQVTGGHSLEIRDAHRWAGVAFGALPAAIVGAVGARTAFAASRASAARRSWKRANVALTIATTVLFTLTGVGMWQGRRLPFAIADAARSAHRWLTWTFALLVAAHVAEVGFAAVRARLGGSRRTRVPAAQR